MRSLTTRLLRAACLSLALLATGTATSAPPVNKQQAIEMFRALPADQQAEILRSINAQPAGQQAPLTQPEVVTPRGRQDKKSEEGSFAPRDGEAMPGDRQQLSPFGEQADTERQPPRDLSPIERQMNRRTDAATLDVISTPRAIEQQLRQFGYDLFDGVPTTFAPATDIPVPADYVIGPGDTVQVQLFGKDNQQYNLVVSRDGALNFPGLGPISVAGLKFDALRQDLSNRISQQMIGVQSSITMGPLRSMRIFVLGDVNRPGSYTVSSLSTVTNALFVSGGIKPIGSLRNVQLKRNGRLVTRLDLYDLLLKGDTSADVRLQPGDVIFVPPIGATVGVAGEVRRPAIYELGEKANVAQLLDLAGGLLPNAYPQAAQLERVGHGGGRTLVDMDLTASAGRTSTVQDGDVLRVYSVMEKMDNIVLLEGHVQRPGGYQWREGMRLTDLIGSARDLLPNPDLHYVLVVHEVGPARQIEVQSTQLDRALAAPNGPENIVLQPRDRVLVFSAAPSAEPDEELPNAQKTAKVALKNQATDEEKAVADKRRQLLTPIIERLRAQARKGQPEQVISAQGQVVFPGEYPLEPGMRAADLIRAAGGLTQQAYAVEAELTRYQVENGRRVSQPLAVDLKEIQGGGGAANLELAPFDRLLVRQVPEWTREETIEIAGEVRFPGQYTIRRGETLDQILQRAGGVTALAYPYGAVFSRKGLREKEAQELRRLQERLQSEVAAVSLEQMQREPQAQQSVSAAKEVLQQLESTEAVGRLVIDLPAVLAGKERVEVRDGDRLIVPREPQEVTVIGQVYQPTSHLFSDKLTRDDYIQLSGGMTSKAEYGAVYVVRANGAVIATSKSRWFGGATQTIQPGDTVVVPVDVERMRPLTLWSTVADIASKLALTAASAHAVGVS